MALNYITYHLGNARQKHRTRHNTTSCYKTKYHKGIDKSVWNIFYSTCCASWPTPWVTTVTWSCRIVLVMSCTLRCCLLLLFVFSFCVFMSATQVCTESTVVATCVKCVVSFYVSVTVCERQAGTHAHTSQQYHTHFTNNSNTVGPPLSEHLCS